MKFWKNLSFEEQMEIMKNLGREQVDETAKKCFFETARLLEDDELAVRMVWKPFVNDFLINTPEEVAEYCRSLAAIECRNARLLEALAVCREKLKDLYGPGMAMEIQNESVDDEGFWFSFRLWNKRQQQNICIHHTDLT